MSLERLLQKKLKPLELKAYLELAVRGPAMSQEDLAHRLDSDKNTIKPVLRALNKLGLVDIAKSGKSYLISARHRIAKSLRVRK